MSVYRKFLAVTGGCVVAISAAYYAVFNYQFDAPIAAAYGVSDWTTLKTQLADEVPGKRLLVFGDSSSLLGLNTPLLGELSGMKTLNMALHGGLPLDWITQYALTHARSGDVVVFAPAWTYYFRDYKNPEEWMLQQIVAWDKAYFQQLDLPTQARFITGIDKQTLLANLQAKDSKEEVLKTYPLRRPLSAEEVRQQYQAAQQSGQQPFSYSFLNISKAGDLQGACGNAIGPLFSYAISNGPSQQMVFAHLEETAKKMKAKGVKFYVAPSITLQDENSEQAEYRAKLQAIMALVKARGVDVIGAPDDFYFPASNFYDTNFHLNCEAADARTNKLYGALKAVL